MIENTTEYNIDILKKFTKFATKKAKIITLICSLIILICSVLEFCLGAYVLGGIFLGLALFFMVANLFTTKFALKKATTMPSIKVEYEFLPDSLNLTTYSNGQQIEKATLAYSTLFKCVECNDLLFLYINKMQALIVDCNKFKESTDKEVVKRYIDSNRVIK